MSESTKFISLLVYLRTLQRILLEEMGVGGTQVAQADPRVTQRSIRLGTKTKI